MKATLAMRVSLVTGSIMFALRQAVSHEFKWDNTIIDVNGWVSVAKS